MKPIIVLFGVLQFKILTQDLQLKVNIRVCIFNSRILWTYKKLFDECGLVISKGLLRKFRNILPRAALIIIYKAFIRPHHDYGDILYDQAYNMSFHQMLGFIQYNSCLAITGAIRGTSKEKLYP